MRATREAVAHRIKAHPAWTAVLLVGLAVLSVVAGCDTGSQRAGSSSESGPLSHVDEVDRAAALATAEAIAGGEWLTATFFDDVPDGAMAYELEHPDEWFVLGEGGFRVVVSDNIPGEPREYGSGVGAMFELMVWDDRHCENNDSGLGEPDDVYEPRADDPFDDSWSLSYDACNNNQVLTALGEVGPTTDPETAAAYLALIKRVADSVRFIDLPMVDEEWTTTLIENSAVELSSPGTHPGRVQQDSWVIAHPVTWSVNEASADSEGWEVSGPLTWLSPGDEMTIRAAPAADVEWADQKAATPSPYVYRFELAQRLPDEITTDGRRQMRFLLEGAHNKDWAVAADMPDLGESSEETHELELLVRHLLLRTSQNQTISFPEGYPGR